jgi:hypothetical protein
MQVQESQFICRIFSVQNRRSTCAQISKIEQECFKIKIYIMETITKPIKTELLLTKFQIRRTQ